MTTERSMEEIFDFLKQTTRFSNRVRDTKRLIWSRGRKKSDPERVGEHCHQLERFALFLNEYLALGLDELKLFWYAHVHDDPEYLEGDTPAFALHGEHEQLELFRKTKEEREAKAQTQIESDWGASVPSYIARLKAYMAQKDPESRLIRALDKVVPILNDLDDNWRSARYLKYTLERHHAYKHPRVQCDPFIAKIYDYIYGQMREDPFFKKRMKSL
jgi:5'-deoxynucleotidase YfbR-like HD superfamily hydrolase